MRADLARPGGAPGRAIDIVQSAARAVGARAFLVGGPVRDMLRGCPSRDLDIAVEGDAAAVARALADETGSELRVPGAFLTFKVPLPDGGEIDIATTRRERYPHPGALPLVEPAEIEEDLLRRDFSANAIALELSSWTLVDPTGGIADIGSRLLRALHAASFLDDPTRILRGFRFAARLGFDWERETRRWLDDAIARDAFATISKERIWRELLNACDEAPGAAAALLSIARSGALATILGVPHDPAEADALERCDREGTAFAQSGTDLTLVKLSLFFANAQLRAASLAGAPMRERARELLVTIARDPRRHVRELATLSGSDAIFDGLSAMLPEERVVAALLEPAVRPLLERFEQAAATRIVSSATELGVPPGPWIGAALRATIRAIFARTITPGEAPAFARRAALDYLREQDRKE
jgi:tRNA nucleotidyltransferase (CCA-adding enzyme)